MWGQGLDSVEERALSPASLQEMTTFYHKTVDQDGIPALDADPSHLYEILDAKVTQARVTDRSRTPEFEAMTATYHKTAYAETLRDILSDGHAPSGVTDVNGAYWAADPPHWVIGYPPVISGDGTMKLVSSSSVPGVGVIVDTFVFDRYCWVGSFTLTSNYYTGYYDANNLTANYVQTGSMLVDAIEAAGLDRMSSTGVVTDQSATITTTFNSVDNNKQPLQASQGVGYPLLPVVQVYQIADVQFIASLNKETVTIVGTRLTGSLSYATVTTARSDQSVVDSLNMQLSAVHAIPVYGRTIPDFSHTITAPSPNPGAYPFFPTGGVATTVDRATFVSKCQSTYPYMAGVYSAVILDSHTPAENYVDSHLGPLTVDLHAIFPPMSVKYSIPWTGYSSYRAPGSALNNYYLFNVPFPCDWDLAATWTKYEPLPIYILPWSNLRSYGPGEIVSVVRHVWGQPDQAAFYTAIKWTNPGDDPLNSYSTVWKLGAVTQMTPPPYLWTLQVRTTQEAVVVPSFDLVNIPSNSYCSYKVFPNPTDYWTTPAGVVPPQSPYLALGTFWGFGRPPAVLTYTPGLNTPTLASGRSGALSLTEPVYPGPQLFAYSKQISPFGGYWLQAPQGMCNRWIDPAAWYASHTADANPAPFGIPWSTRLITVAGHTSSFRPPFYPFLTDTAGTPVWEAVFHGDALDQSWVWCIQRDGSFGPGGVGAKDMDFKAKDTPELVTFAETSAPGWRNQYRDVRIVVSDKYADLPDVMDDVSKWASQTGGKGSFHGPKLDYGVGGPVDMSADLKVWRRRTNVYPNGEKAYYEYPINDSAAHFYLGPVGANSTAKIMLGDSLFLVADWGSLGDDWRVPESAQPWIDTGNYCSGGSGKNLVMIDPATPRALGYLGDFVPHTGDGSNIPGKFYADLASRLGSNLWVQSIIKAGGLSGMISGLKTVTDRSADAMRLPVTVMMVPSDGQGVISDSVKRSIWGMTRCGPFNPDNADFTAPFFQVNYSTEVEWARSLTSFSKSDPLKCAPLVMLANDGTGVSADAQSVNTVFRVPEEVVRYDGTYRVADMKTDATIPHGTPQTSPKGGTLASEFQHLMASKGKPRNIAICDVSGLTCAIDWQLIRARNYWDLQGSQLGPGELSDKFWVANANVRTGSAFGDGLGAHMVDLAAILKPSGNGVPLLDPLLWLFVNYEQADYMVKHGGTPLQVANGKRLLRGVQAPLVNRPDGRAWNF